MKRLLLLSLVCFLTSNYAEAEDNLCGQIWLKPDTVDLNLSVNEKRLVCGDDEVAAWSSVSLNQAQYHLTVFLQERGFFFPTFSREKASLVVDIGPRSHARNLEIIGEPPDFYKRQKRHVKGQVLTPGLLDEVEDWSTRQLKSIGYACPAATIASDPKTGLIRVEIEPGEQLYLVDVAHQPTDQLDERAFQRYYAFRIGELYNEDLLTLTSQRMLSDGIVQSSYFTTECRSAGAVANHNFLLGKPRLVTIGAGASTEEFPLIRILWRNARLNPLGSSVTAKLNLSPRDQLGLVRGEIYFFPDAPRVAFISELTVERMDEVAYETTNIRLGASAGWSTDDQTKHFGVQMGPAFNKTYVVTGGARGESDYLTLDGQILLRSHYFEFYRQTPRTGYESSFSIRSRRKGFGSDISANVYAWEGKLLFNYRKFEPPFFVAGMRFNVATTEYGRSLTAREQLPPQFRHYLGGQENLRGFAREEVNNLGRGYLSMGYVGIEGRFLTVLPANLQPFAFADFAKVGTTELTLGEGYFWSPGIGMRWPSPVGTFRFTVAHGFVEDVPIAKEQDELSHWQFFVSYGMEF